MLNSLVVDVGNTNTKLAVFHGSALVAVQAVVTKRANAALDKLLAKYKPQHSVLSDVGKSSTQLAAVLKSKTKLFTVTSNSPVPIEVKYRSKTLGTDRLALAVLAHNIFPNQNTLVVSAGTCITYNFVNAAGQYLGGGISPGVVMRLQAMHEHTAQLPKVKLDSSVTLIGDTTQASMQSGALLGAAHEVNGFVAAYKKQHKGLRVILAGGDAAYLQPHLKFRIFARPYAALEGLQRILQHNIGAL